jgi:hypothetical protein
VRDKWILSSALQKLIRRGKPSAAIAVALRLHEVDSGYLQRRLPIIALEDIGVGDIELCCEVLTGCSSTKWWRDDARITIATLAGSLANAVKSRAACDAECLAAAHPETPSQLPALLAATPSQLVSWVAETQRPRLERMNALRVLGGISERQGARYVTVSRCDLDSLGRVAVELNLPPNMRWLMAHCRKASSLAAMLPIVVEAGADRVVRTGDAFPRALDMLDGVPLCGVDMFSECGRGALREFFLASPKFIEFAGRCVRARSPLRLFNMALFHAESSGLDRYLSSPGLDELTRQVESEEMRSLGMTEPGNREELRDLIRGDADRLAAIRTKRLTAVFDLALTRGLDAEASHV